MLKNACLSELICSKFPMLQEVEKRLFTHLHNTHYFFTHFSFLFFFLVLYTEKACPQLAKANLGEPCLNKQITIIYSQKLINKKKKKVLGNNKEKKRTRKTISLT